MEQDKGEEWKRHLSEQTLIKKAKDELNSIAPTLELNDDNQITLDTLILIQISIGNPLKDEKWCI